MYKTELPWLAPILEGFDRTLRSGRFPHALLLTGPEGVGKFCLARALAAKLLCSDHGRESPPCGSCKSCILFAAGNHPDFYEVLLPDDKSSIGVDQIRALSGNLTLTSNLGGRRVAIISPADLMTRSAANSLLKTLEEPPDGTVLVLVAARPVRLPATVRSRCQRINQARPPNETAASWLAEQDSSVDWGPLLLLAEGAPLKAIALQKDGLGKLDSELGNDLTALAGGRGSPLDIAKRWEKIGAIRCVEWMHASVAALARAKAVSGKLSPDLQKVGENINLSDLLAYADELLRARSLLETPANTSLILEKLLIPWTRKLSTPPNWQQAGKL